MTSVASENGKKVLTMAEYIDKEKAIAIADKFGCNNGSCIGKHSGVAYVITSLISDLPAADVAPVRHGKWIFGKDLPYSWGQIPKNKYHLYCSECLEQAFNRSEDNDPDFDADTSYCPNCGAKMDGGDGNSDICSKTI